MDSELREAFATLSSQIATVGADAREASTRSRDTYAAVNRLESRVGMLEGAVFGSKPPPAPPPVPLSARITEGEGSVAELTGVVLAVKGELAEHRAASEEYRAKTDAKLDEQTALLVKISGAVSGVLTHPMTKRLGLAAGTLLLLWFGSMQARMQERLDKLPESPIYQPDAGPR